MEALEDPGIKRHLINVEQYHRMGEAGVFERGARVELIEGEVIDMAPIGSRHWSVVNRLNQLLTQAVADRAIVSVQSSLRLDPSTELQPDVTIVKPRPDFYAHALPMAGDAWLVIEVADSSALFDLRTKAPLYARHGVAACWVVDLPAKVLHAYAQPQGDVYTQVDRLAAPGVIELPGLDGVTVDLTDLFQR